MGNINDLIGGCRIPIGRGWREAPFRVAPLEPEGRHFWAATQVARNRISEVLTLEELGSHVSGGRGGSTGTIARASMLDWARTLSLPIPIPLDPPMKSAMIDPVLFFQIGHSPKNLKKW